MQKCMAAAEALSLPYALSAVLTSVADLQMLRRASQAVEESAEVAIALSTREGFPYFLARATILRGWALAERGQAEAGIAQIRQGLAAFRATGAGLWMPRYLGLLAEACGKAGQVDEGLTVLAEALEITRRTGEREYEAELCRLKGELTLAGAGGRGGARRKAEECFREAVDTARRQSAKSFELRAVMSLGRLPQARGKRKEAHQTLAEVYGWFTEGFDTADLKQARALLEELGSGRVDRGSGARAARVRPRR